MYLLLGLAPSAAAEAGVAAAEAKGATPKADKLPRVPMDFAGLAVAAGEGSCSLDVMGCLLGE